MIPYFEKFKNLIQSLIQPKDNHNFFSEYVKHNNSQYDLSVFESKLSKKFSTKDTSTETLIKSVLFSIDWQLTHSKHSILFNFFNEIPKYINATHARTLYELHNKTKPFFQTYKIFPEKFSGHGFYILNDRRLEFSSLILNHIINNKELLLLTQKIYKKHFSENGLIFKSLFYIQMNNTLFTTLQKIQEKPNKTDIFFLHKMKTYISNQKNSMFFPDILSFPNVVSDNFTQITALFNLTKNNPRVQKEILTIIEIGQKKCSENKQLNAIHTSYILNLKKIHEVTKLEDILSKPKPTIANKTKLHKI